MAPKHRTKQPNPRHTNASRLRQARDRKYGKIYHEPIALRFHNGLRLAVREKRHYKWLQYFRLANAFMIQVGTQFGAYQWVGHQVLRWGLVEAAIWFVGKKDRRELKEIKWESDMFLKASEDKEKEEEEKEEG